MGKNSGPRDENTDIRIYPNPDCRFAYTLNNTQPVRCTWISDEPLFFADYDAAYDDEDAILADDPVFQALEKDIADLKGKTSVYEKISQEFLKEIIPAEDKFDTDADFITSCIAHKGQSLDDLLDMLGQSRLAAQYLGFAKVHGIQLAESRQVADACYDRDAKTIFIRSDLEPTAQIMLAARELRRMWQHKNGAGLHPLTFHPDHAVLINRAQNADLLISMIRVAWELQLAGHKDAWAFVENSQLHDLGRAFAREACVDFRSLNSGKAAAACLESWFLSERCRRCDRHLIQQMLADYQGYVFSDNVEASRAVAANLLTALGKMPFGQNYLFASLNQIMNDPIFTDVRDRSNANFLWFIKFERSFTEAENEMVAEAEKMAPAQPVQSATIIAFPAPAKAAPARKVASKGRKPAAPTEISSATSETDQ